MIASGTDPSQPAKRAIAGYRPTLDATVRRCASEGLLGNVFHALPTLRPGVVCMDALLTNFAYPPHSHEHLCVGLMLDGEKNSRYGLRRHSVRKGDVILVNPGEVHDGRPSGSRSRRYTMLEIAPSAFRELCMQAIERDWVEFKQPVLRDPRTRDALMRWLAALKGAQSGQECEAAVMFFGLLSSPSDGPKGQGDLRGVTAAVVARIKERLEDEKTIGQLAAEMGLSRYQLIRAFKEAVGLTPEDFRRQARVHRARALLGSRRALAEIAADAGFADQSHMTREFRRLVGPSPAAYRAALQ